MSDNRIAAATALTDLLQPETLAWSSGSSEPEKPPFHRAVVHQAAGILCGRHATPVDDALVRLKAYAFSHQRAIIDVARDVITGRLRLPQDAT
ncbi:ANTAR domain-containing protein [Amycolatopsis alba]|uniref:ANTAR domain-containing protein n=1 Tax=Amycolatopsis alba DSM 44262 TaxID=1125972 RepID=A0A229S7Q4_AMYAL|nr:ANTAR domain-containing protein [Amycolatopsis alba]OXM54982.1 ANTAR domain-containing protein [Amycolatopsis alba DSM 44262]